MVRKPKLSQTLIKGLLVGLLPFACAAIDNGSVDFPVTGLAIIMVPVIWFSLIIWHLTATKAAKMCALVNLTNTAETATDAADKTPLVIKGPKVSHTLMKALIITVALVVFAWVGLRLEPFVHGASGIGIAVFLLPLIWWWLFVEHNSAGHSHAYIADFSGHAMNLSRHDYGTNSQMEPSLSAMEHNQLSTQTFHAPVMTRTPDYSLGPDSGMYTTRWH